ncbi:MAG: hypothetical protein AAF441_21335 [Pseudomonadota bacterium]
MKRILALVAVVATLTLGACASLDREDGSAYFGDDIAILAVAVDAANEAGILVIQAGNLEPEEIVRVQEASANAVNALYELYLFNGSYERGEGTQYNVIGTVPSVLATLRSLHSVTRIDGSPLSGTDWIQVISQLLVGSYPEMADLRAAIRAAEASGTTLDPAVVQTMIDNTFGSLERLNNAAGVGLPAARG